MGDIPIGRIAGFRVKANWSVLVILWLFTWSLASTLPDTSPGYPKAAYWVAGLSGALVLLASLLAHELTHAFFARRAGVTVEGVTLWLFGGVTRLGGEARTPREAFRIAVSGPLMSVVLAAVFGAVAFGLGAVGVAPVVVGVAWWLAGINLVLGLFNLLPGAPLDGGRVLKAYLWRRTGDPVRAGVGAARAGRVVAFILIGAGLVDIPDQSSSQWRVAGISRLVHLRRISRRREPGEDPACHRRCSGGRHHDQPPAHCPSRHHRRGFHSAIPAGRPPLRIPGRRPTRIDHRTDHSGAAAWYHPGPAHLRLGAGGGDTPT